MALALRRHGHMTVRRLTGDDAEALREIRLEALRLHPTAFSADPDVEGAFPIERWREHLDTRAWFGAFADNALVGINAFSTESYSKKTAHVAHLGAMYVRGAARGSGAADALMKNFVEYAKGRAGQIVLTVEAENRRAVKLYERHGFEVVGRLPASIRVDGKDYDELSMHRRVSNSD
jgi:ribosomal protein S18 acetylase RimI-like enzyme